VSFSKPIARQFVVFLSCTRLTFYIKDNYTAFDERTQFLKLYEISIKMNLKRVSCMITSHNQVQRYLYTKSDPRVLNDETPKSHCYNKIINNFPRIFHAVTFSWERRSEYKLLIGEKRKSSEYIACNGKIAASDVLNHSVRKRL